MNKKSIFNKINDMYTKATKVIIGDIPHDGNVPQEKSTYTEKIALTNKLISLKEKFLTMGTPDAKSMLYIEVVKKEKEKNYLNLPLKQTSAKETNSSTKTPTKVTATVTKKISTKEVSIKKPTSLKKVAKKSEENKGVTTSKTKKDQKTQDTKKKPETRKKTKVAKTTETLNKSQTTPKRKSAPRGAQKAAKIALYIKDIKKHYGVVDEEFVAIIVKNLGPSIYKKDAELVSCSEPKELDTVRKNFLKKKLGIDASTDVLNAAIQDVCTELKGVRNKYRATFYYALAKKFKKESALS